MSARNKRYYFLKMPDDFFQSKRIKRLRKLAGGDTYTIIYLKMQLKAINTEGVIYYDGLEETIAKEIALELDENEDDVIVTMNFLEKCGLLEVREEGDIYLPYAQIQTDSITDSSLRSRKSRAKKALQCNTDATQPQLSATESKELRDKSKDIRVREYTDEKSETDFSTPDSDSEKPKTKAKAKDNKIPTLEQVTKYCKYRKNKINPKRFIEYYNQKGWDDVKDWRSAVRGWEELNFEDYKSRDKPNSFNQFEQNDYDFDELEKIIVDN